MDTHAPDRTADQLPWRLVYPTDTVCKAVLDGMAEPVEPPRRMTFRNAIGQRGIEPGWWVSALGVVLLALVMLVIGVYSDDSFTWTFYWEFAILAILAQMAILWAIWYLRRGTARSPDGVKTPDEVSVRSLHRAALAGNDELAPTIAAHGFAVPIAAHGDVQSGQQDGDGETIPVRPLQWRFQRGFKIASGVIAGMLGLFWAAQWIQYASGGTFPWQAVSFWPLLILLYLGFYFSLNRSSRAIRVTVSNDGLHWHNHVQPWAEVRGWYVLHMHPVNTSWTHPSAAFTVLGQRASLTWLAYPHEVDIHDPGQRLVQLVSSHINVPLRDLTPGAIRISYEVGSRLFRGRIRLLSASERHMHGAHLPTAPLAAITLALSVLVLLGGIFAPQAQQWYFGGQLARLETAKAAIHDPLTSDSLGWKVAPSYGGNNFAFTPQGYTYISSNCCEASSLAARALGNGVVAVTILQQASDVLNEAGIVFRANAGGGSALAFVMAPVGYWYLYRFTMEANSALTNKQYLRSSGGHLFGRSQPIHTGHGAPNRLAVLMQGSVYTFFINGQFVARYWASDLPQSGQIGVFVESFDGSVTFSDMAITPA